MIEELLALGLLFVNSAVILATAKNSRTFWLLPNLAIATFTVLYIIPLAQAEPKAPTFWGVALCDLALVTALLCFRGKKSGAHPNEVQATPGHFLPLLGVFYASVCVLAAYLSLIDAGGLGVVLSKFVGSGYQ